MRLRARLNRYHVWLGWLIGVPMLFWTVSGLFMVGFPIEEVRGTHLRSEAAVLDGGSYVLPGNLPADAVSVTVEKQAGRPRWIVERAGGEVSRADGGTGAPLPPVDAAEARAIAASSFAGTAQIEGMTLFSPDENPLDLRRGRPAWQLRYSDGTHLYIDRDSGRVLAVRTRLWRAYDWMWGLHIMDLQGRENSHHVLLYGFGALAALGAVLGLVLLPMTGRRRRRSPPS